jgi:hypothetical protein
MHPLALMKPPSYATVYVTINQLRSIHALALSVRHLVDNSVNLTVYKTFFKKIYWKSNLVHTTSASIKMLLTGSQSELGFT